MTQASELKERLSAPDWDMWLALGANVLERLADAKTARRAAEKAQVAVRAVPQEVTAPAVAKAASVADAAGSALPRLSRAARRAARRARDALPDLPSAVPAAALPARLMDSPAVPRVDANRAARRLNRAAGILAASVLADSAVEHYRGAFHNKAMYTPLAVSALSLAVSAHGVADRRPAAHRVRDVSYLLTAATGLAGSAFHFKNVRAKVGSFRWQNLFYGAPLGAPAAIALSGFIGFLAERVRANKPGTTPRILLVPAGRVVGLATAGGIMGTVAEAALLHFRGTFQDPFMYLPVTVPPIAAAAIGRAALAPGRTRRAGTRWWLRASALVGIAGSAFHVYGVGRAMGGWRNWRQNVVDGPPIPAPPAFTGLALAGLAALDLLEDRG